MVTKEKNKNLKQRVCVCGSCFFLKKGTSTDKKNQMFDKNIMVLTNIERSRLLSQRQEMDDICREDWSNHAQESSDSSDFELIPSDDDDDDSMSNDGRVAPTEKAVWIFLIVLFCGLFAILLSSSLRKPPKKIK